MIGGGFLGQMHETMKKNREMIRASLGKTKRKPFDNGEYTRFGEREKLTDEKNLTEEERRLLIAGIIEDNKKTIRRKIVILFITILVLAGMYLGLRFFL